MMRFDTPATTNPIDQGKVIGKPITRIDGPLKTTGKAIYAYEWHDPNTRYAYGYIVVRQSPRAGSGRWMSRPRGMLPA